MGATQTIRFTSRVRSIGAIPRSAPRHRTRTISPCVLQARNAVKPSASSAVDEEWEIVQRAIAGDSEPLAALFARERDRLYRTAFGVLRNKEDAEDALQMGYLSAYTNLTSFEGKSKFSTWLTRIVLNAALMNRRKLRLLPHLSLDEIAAGNPLPWADRLIDSQPDPEQVCAQTETREIVDKELSQLSPLLRSAFRLRFIADLSTPEAAELLRVKLSATKSRASRARQRVARLLSAKGVDAWCVKFQPAGGFSATT